MFIIQGNGELQVEISKNKGINFHPSKYMPLMLPAGLRWSALWTAGSASLQPLISPCFQFLCDAGHRTGLPCVPKYENVRGNLQFTVLPSLQCGIQAPSLLAPGWHYHTELREA